MNAFARSDLFVQLGRGLEYADCIPYRGVWPPLQKGVFWVWHCIWRSGSRPGALGNVEYTFIAITPRPTLTRSDSNWLRAKSICLRIIRILYNQEQNKKWNNKYLYEHKLANRSRRQPGGSIFKKLLHREVEVGGAVILSLDYSTYSWSIPYKVEC